MLSDGRQGHRAAKRHQADLGSILALNLDIHFALPSIHFLICKMGMIARLFPGLKTAVPGRFSVVAVETGSKTPVPGSGRDADVLWSPSVGEEVDGSRNGSTTRSADQRKKAQRKNLPQLWGYRAEPPDLLQDPVSVACGGLTVPPPRGHIPCLQRPPSVSVGHVPTAHASIRGSGAWSYL